MHTVLLIVHLTIALALVGVILMQRSEGGALGIGGGGGGGGGGGFGGLMSTRGSANFLTRTTAILAGGFILTSLLLAILAGQATSPDSLLDSMPAGPAGGASAPAPGLPEAPAVPSAPAVPAEPTTPVAPAEPAAPVAR